MLYLASRSPRRRELLARLGIGFSVLELDVPEQRQEGENAQAYVSRVARDKALAGLARVAGVPDALVLGCDTEVVLDEDVFGKPRDNVDAVAMLRRLSGAKHTVISSVSLVSASRQEAALSVSSVRFGRLPDAVIHAYVASGEPFGKAGGYAIQGLAEAFVERLDGSYSGVMGLPLHQSAQLLAKFGLGPLAAALTTCATEAP
ncbi:Maf family protein [Lysobacter sp. A03]|uniref:Maf family protein n=1 Tax=Lysobacter sp. A03 TaxID=1199154 RepID=UPI0005B6AB10|nr:Maf family protein [Lysobacter sp. A03]KIQ96900.1 Septum formation protein Maf [Lysobacter sp. A03]